VAGSPLARRGSLSLVKCLVLAALHILRPVKARTPGEKVSGTFFLTSAKSEETLADQGRPRNPKTSITWRPSPGSVRAQQKIVAPGLSPARGYVAASSPRHGGVPMGSGQVPPPLRHADLKVSATTQGINSAKPFTQEQVSNMVRAGLGDDSGAMLIELPGIAPPHLGARFRR